MILCVILNVAPDGATITGSASASTVISSKVKFLEQISINSTSQLINSILNALQKLLKCFSEITTFRSVNESLFSDVFPTILVLYLNDSELEDTVFK